MKISVFLEVNATAPCRQIPASGDHVSSADNTRNLFVRPSTKVWARLHANHLLIIMNYNECTENKYICQYQLFKNFLWLINETNAVHAVSQDYLSRDHELISTKINRSLIWFKTAYPYICIELPYSLIDIP